MHTPAPKAYPPISELPEGWIVFVLEVEGDSPYAVAMDESLGNDTRYALPPSLAYYLLTHWSGTPSMQRQREERIREEWQSKARRLFGLDDD